MLKRNSLVMFRSRGQKSFCPMRIVAVKNGQYGREFKLDVDQLWWLEANLMPYREWIGVCRDVRRMLQELSDHAILVGSAARGDEYNDIDLVVNEKGLSIAKDCFPAGWKSAFIGNIKTFATTPPIEVFTHWYGPDYRDLCRRRTEIIDREILDIRLRAWPIETRGLVR